MNSMGIPNLIRKIMEEQGMTIKELSERSSVSYISMKRFFLQNQPLSYDKFLRVLKSLEVDLEDLLIRKTKRSIRTKESVLEDVTKLLLNIKPYKLKPLIRLIFNGAERSKGINQNKIAEIKTDFNAVF